MLTAYDAAAARLERLAYPLLPTLARMIFAGVFLVYFWSSALTKLGDWPFSPSAGAYVQIFPRSFEAVGYDPAGLTLVHTLVVVAGTWAEFLLPALIVLGLLTRLAALGMIGFVIVQSWVDVFGHGLGAADVGAWFDRSATALILDQRPLWVLLLAVLVFAGAGPFSLDRALARFR
jgi:putative oxidoreductase